jgi:hypothetical protein
MNVPHYGLSAVSWGNTHLVPPMSEQDKYIIKSKTCAQEWIGLESAQEAY